MVLDVDRDDGAAGVGLGCDGVELAELLDGGFDGVGELLRDFGGGGAGPGGDDLRRFDGVLGVFEAADGPVGDDARRENGEGKGPGDGLAGMR